ncbi:carbohydrate-binding module family 18 protein [Aaosphaeria arxii CBS 175.79]|uniref:Carbohydrate-binding module family 18 protein n=1 Tax=Aaosphaeria arxii CBS 175.79 TaxID=1450172 RepID=A0A6A5XXE4_9PLEO|nr:carbohydrate-binding module family 18 protein [Aaosphaeria arxii CBS 175.79]KAF2017310.1 carbohydrate-binding module family 18 protein [Aaosphaeria arxii CBS 175.79]
MRFTLASIAALAAVAYAQCGPNFDNKMCEAGQCCSQYGWCGTTQEYCDAATCMKQFSGAQSTCNNGQQSGQNPVQAPGQAPGQNPGQTIGEVPNIDVCGNAQGGISCPGVGLNGYFYRCCSSAGHCGPKNDLQDEAMYCGTGCQAGFGKCNSQPKPTQSPSNAGTAQSGETCGPIVNKRCASGLCCSGSNFCGTGPEFCGSDNWCQSNWGNCS